LPNLESTVDIAVSSLGLSLVELERAPRGLLRIFIDRMPDKGRVTVEDCALVSHHLSHLLTVESVDYERLEVSSPGLDRVLRTMADFARFQQLPVKVRLNTAVNARKRFEGVVESVEGNNITFVLSEANANDNAVNKKLSVSNSSTNKKRSNAKAKSIAAAVVPDKITAKNAPEILLKKITVALAQIEKARLVPQIEA